MIAGIECTPQVLAAQNAAPSHCPSASPVLLGALPLLGCFLIPHPVCLPNTRILFSMPFTSFVDAHAEPLLIDRSAGVKCCLPFPGIHSPLTHHTRPALPFVSVLPLAIVHAHTRLAAHQPMRWVACILTSCPLPL